MAKNYRREKLAAEPARVRGYRTIKTRGGHLVRLALLPTGGARAVAVYHPTRDRNVDMFYDAAGRKRPIRGSPGYDEYMAGDLTGQRGGPSFRERMAYIKAARTPPGERAPRGPKGSGAAARAERAERVAAAKKPKKVSRLSAQRQIAAYRALERSQRGRNPHRRPSSSSSPRTKPRRTTRKPAARRRGR
jgi:hypothetical protein